MAKKNSIPGLIVFLVSVLAVGFSLWHFFQHRQEVLAKDGKEVFPVWFSFEGKFSPIIIPLIISGKVLRSRESSWFWLYPGVAVVSFFLFWRFVTCSPFHFLTTQPYKQSRIMEVPHHDHS